MTSESTAPAVWFPSVLEYGGGTMHHAALRGDIEAIAKLAVDGTPVRFARRNGAARASQRTSLAQVHDVGLGGATPLHVAALTADSELAAAELIARGAPVNAEDAWGATPLHCMVANRRMHGATAVLASGADVNRPLQAIYTHRAGVLLSSLTRARARVRSRREAKARSVSRATHPSTLLAGDGSTMWR